MDGAFFSNFIVHMPEANGVEFTISAPFDRLTALKCIVEERKRWHALDGRWSFFETQWKPKSWSKRRRFVCIRQRNRIQHKEPVQLNLFVPYDYGYDFKVIVTNKQIAANKVLNYHNGREYIPPPDRGENRHVKGQP